MTTLIVNSACNRIPMFRNLIFFKISNASKINFFYLIFVTFSSVFIFTYIFIINTEFNLEIKNFLQLFLTEAKLFKKNSNY